jgi:hypothetical protein
MRRALRRRSNSALAFRRRKARDAPGDCRRPRRPIGQDDAMRGGGDHFRTSRYDVL